MIPTKKRRKSWIYNVEQQNITRFLFVYLLVCQDHKSSIEPPTITLIIKTNIHNIPGPNW